MGASYVFDGGFFGFSFKTLDSNYGVPGAHHEEGEEEEEEGEEEEETIRIDLQQDRYDLNGEIGTDLLFIDRVKVRFGYADYVHQELEGAEIGTVFRNEGYEARLELIEKEYGNFRGASGVQFSRRDFEAIGEEAFTPPNITEQFGIFTIREYQSGPIHLQLAGRFEHTDVESRSTDQRREFNTGSVSAGIGFAPNENIFLGLNLLRTARAPAAEELFSDGPHLATNAFEIGDPT